MSWSIITDPHRRISVLVADEPLIALGPAIAADEPEESEQALRAFAENLDSPPDELPAIVLLREWVMFQVTLSGNVVVPLETAQLLSDAAAEVEAGRNPYQAQDGAREAAQSPELEMGEGLTVADWVKEPIPDVDSQSELDETGVDDSPLVDVEPDELHDRLQQLPNGTPAQRGEAECWACGGLGVTRIGDSDETCNVCQGAGKVPASVS